MKYVYVVEFNNGNIPYVSHQFSEKVFAINSMRAWVSETVKPLVKRITLTTYDCLGFNTKTLNPDIYYEV